MKKRSLFIVVTVIITILALVFSVLYLSNRYRLPEPPHPGARTYLILFTWEEKLQSLTVLKEDGRTEERDSEIKRVITVAAEKALPSVIRHLDLHRAQGTLPCWLSGRRGQFTADCPTSLDTLPEAFDPDARKPLLLAADRGDANRIKELLRSGANVNTADQHGGTALMRAVRLKDTNALSILIAAGADVNDRDAWGRTALFYAVENENTGAVRVLITAGANANIADDKGWTALMGATSPEILRALIAAGADVNAREAQGRTALTIAESGNRTYIADLLRKFGARH